MALTGLVGAAERKKGALVVIEPPSEFGRIAEFEIYDGVFVAVERGFIKQRTGAMHHWLKALLPIGIYLFAVKAAKHGGG